jgi:hypothetical protein
MIMDFANSMIGWYHKDNSDKIWGAILVKPMPLPLLLQEYSYTYGVWMIFWGRRGRALQTKLTIPMTDRDMHQDHFQKKLDKGYERVARNKLDQVYPEFQDDLEKTTMWTMLKA